MRKGRPKGSSSGTVRAAARSGVHSTAPRAPAAGRRRSAGATDDTVGSTSTTLAAIDRRGDRSPQDQHAPGRGLAMTGRSPRHRVREVVRAGTAVGGSDHWRRMVDGLPIGAVFFAAGEVHMNRTAEILTGYEPHELSTEEAWFTKLYGRRAPRMLARHRKGWQRNFPEPITVTIRRKDGTKRTVEFRAARHDDAAIAVMQDVTERQELQRQGARPGQRRTARRRAGTPRHRAAGPCRAGVAGRVTGQAAAGRICHTAAGRQAGSRTRQGQSDGPAAR